MSKNNKGNQNNKAGQNKPAEAKAPVEKKVADTVKTDANTKKPVEKASDKPKDKAPVVDKKPTTTVIDPPPVETDATGTVEQPTVEEVKTPVSNFNIPGTSVNINSLATMLGEEDILDANHTAILLSTIERRVARMKPNEPLTIQMESMLDYNLAWSAIKLSVQTFAKKKELNMLVPNDELVVQDFVDTFASMGVALEAHPTADSKQMELTFTEKGISPETKAAAEEEVNKEKETEVKQSFKHEAKKLTPEQMDPMTWKSDDDAKLALAEDLKVTGETFSNKFLRLLGKVRTYRQNQETDPVKKNTWDTVSLGFLAKDLIGLIGPRATIILNGIVSATVNSLKIGAETMIFAHANLRKNMPALNDAEITSLVKAFIEIMHSDPKQPLDEDLAVKNGILTPTRDLFLRIAMENPSEKEDLGKFKKILNPFYFVYKDEIGSRTKEVDGKFVEDTEFPLKAVNKMIEIRNHYVDKEAAFPLFTLEDFKAVAGA